jgi:hypothetical protein
MPLALRLLLNVVSFSPFRCGRRQLDDAVQFERAERTRPIPPAPIRMALINGRKGRNGSHLMRTDALMSPISPITR